jgi:hypothetical protein
MTDTYRQTIEEAADLLEICAAGGSPGASRLLPLADALRSGLVPALERAREEERIRMADVLAWVHGIDPLPAPTSPGTGTPPSAADAEPFCACGRRVSECDGSRAGCREEGSRD